MGSAAKQEWDTVARARLDALEQVQREVAGRVPPWAAEHLARGLFVILLAHFQTYARDLHDDAIEVHVAHANPRQASILRDLARQGRDLDRKNPRPAALGSDFARLSIPVVGRVRAFGPASAQALWSLDLLATFRNAVAHGNEGEVAGLVAHGDIAPTLRSFREQRGHLDTLVGSMDIVVPAELADRLQVPPPW